MMLPLLFFGFSRKKTVSRRLEVMTWSVALLKVGTMIKIAPSVLAADFLTLGEQIREAEKAGADRLHLDVMDGRFVPNISFGMPVVAAVRKGTSLPLETHLMIVEPERYVEA